MKFQNKSGFEHQEACALDLMSQAVEEREGVRASYFTSLEEAKIYCGKEPSAIGVSTSDDKYVVYSTKKGPPYQLKDTYEPLQPIRWIYLKAWYEPGSMNVVCNLKGTTKTICKKGCIREIYSLSNTGWRVKLIHHTCKALNMKKKCRSCRVNNPHTKCNKGSAFYYLSE